MMPGASIPTSGGANADLPEYEEDEVSKIIYPPTHEEMSEEEFVGKAVKGKYGWIGWLLLAGLAFGIFMAACTTLAEYLIK